MNITLIVLVVFILSVGSLIAWIWSIIDAAKTPDNLWAAAGQSKILWIVLIVVVGVVASLVYVLWPRPMLKKAAARIAQY